METTPTNEMEKKPANETAQPTTPGKAAKAVNVLINLTKGGKACDVTVPFNTVRMLTEINAADDGSNVKITTVVGEATNVLFDGTRNDAITAVMRSIIPPEGIVPELQKFMQFMLDHSTLKGIGIHLVYEDPDGKDAGFGMVTTAADCTAAQAVALVNCGDANIDEFVARAKLEIPGRKAAPGTIITPTADQVEKLG